MKQHTSASSFPMPVLILPTTDLISNSNCFPFRILTNSLGHPLLSWGLYILSFRPLHLPHKADGLMHSSSFSYGRLFCLHITLQCSWACCYVAVTVPFQLFSIHQSNPIASQPLDEYCGYHCKEHKVWETQALGFVVLTTPFSFHNGLCWVYQAVWHSEHNRT